MRVFGVILLSYLLGSVPFGLIAGLLRGVDLRRHGSGNIGATNAGRILGRPTGIAVFFLDFAKGWAAAALFPTASGVSPGQLPWVAVGCLFAAVAGHNWSLFLRFKGGKGVAASAGGLVGLLPWSALAGGLLFFAVVWFSGFVSLGSILAAVSVPLLLPVIYGFPPPLPYLVLSVLLAVLVVFRHRSNIQRLAAGTENRVSWARKRGNRHRSNRSGEGSGPG